MSGSPADTVTYKGRVFISRGSPKIRNPTSRRHFWPNTDPAIKVSQISTPAIPSDPPKRRLEGQVQRQKNKKSHHKITTGYSVFLHGFIFVHPLLVYFYTPCKFFLFSLIFVLLIFPQSSFVSKFRY